MSLELHEILKSAFGYSQFRDRQKEIIESVLSGKDTLVIMPTGGGKSMCFQLPALMMDGLTIVVSPLIALMNDQVSALKELGIAAGTLHSNQSSEKLSEIYAQISSRKIKLLYLSPEGILNRDNYLFLKTQKISLFAIDEAHCVSIWGNDFRPDYVKLAFIKKEYPDVPMIALTATADHNTQLDIIKQLKLNDPNHFLSSFERKNIAIKARPGQKRIEQIYEFINQEQHLPGIIYCLSKKSTENLSEKLRDRGYKADYYHAGRSAKDRKDVQDRFQSDQLTIVCATIAFGMGIDKPNIRWVVHYNMPKNVEGYYQEIGRAGRDGLPSTALLFYGWADYTMLNNFIDDSPANDHFKELQRAKLERMWQFANALSCRTNLILNYFGEYRVETCGQCDNCLFPAEYFDGSRYSKMAISAVIRSKQKIGQNLLVDVLRGSGKQEIRTQGLDQIKTYGVGREVPQRHWHFYINQMINQGLLAIDFSDGSRIKTTPITDKVLRDEMTPELAKYVDLSKVKAKVKSNSKIEIVEYNEQLFEKLRTWRLKLAREKKVPPYIIFGDRTLKSIAALIPKNNMELLNVDGIGKKKLDEYGMELLEMTHNY